MEGGLRHRIDRPETAFKPLPGNRFRFSCHPGVPCFTECCADLNLILTPYDILRLKNRLGMDANVFLDEYTVQSETGASTYPMIQLKMGNDDRRRCPFVSEEGCTVYEDRPGACRLYPLGRGTASGSARELYFVVDESHCLGFKETKEWDVEEWIRDQGADVYNEMNRQWMEIVTSPNTGRTELTDQKLQMFYMTSYNLDRFRAFVFQTKFLEIFSVEPDEIETLKTDDVALMQLGMRWLRFALFGERTSLLKG